jgi:16S rRNA (cytosine967-C5)-methyltransferase
MWEKMYTKEAVDAFLPCINEKPPLFAVPNTLFVDADELQYELFDEGIKSEVEGELVKITSSFDISKSKAFERGLFHIEDKSSFECAKALGVKDGDTVLDVCAAPGGKSFTLAERMNGGGAVYSFDLYEHRVKLISDGAKRLGLENIIAKVNDAEVYNERLPRADKVLCDVPCSGFGIIRRKPEIRYKDLDSIKTLPELQYKILCTSARYLKEKGTLVYSTCTLNKRENEAVAQCFLEENNNFKLRDMKTVFPSFDGGDGFFYAVMEKIND